MNGFLFMPVYNTRDGYYKVKESHDRKHLLVKIIYEGTEPQTANILLSNGEYHQFQFFPAGQEALAAEKDIPTPPFDTSPDGFKKAKIAVSKDPTPPKRLKQPVSLKTEYQDCTTRTYVKSFWGGKSKGFYRQISTVGEPAFVDEKDMTRLHCDSDKDGKAMVRFQFLYKKKEEKGKKKNEARRGSGIKGFWKAVLRVGEKATAN